jgi:hypothetical protein
MMLGRGGPLQLVRRVVIQIHPESNQEHTTMQRISLAIVPALAATVVASAQVPSVRTGPSSSATPYAVLVPGSAVVDLVSLMTVGDSVGGFTLYGLPDGMGALAAGAGSFDLYINHEIAATVGGVRRAHQPEGFTGGAFISKLRLDSTNFSVVSGAEAMQTCLTVTNGTGGSLYNFQRFCSGEIPAENAFFNSATGLGTSSRFYVTGEEGGTPGRMTATDLTDGLVYQMTAFDASQGSWENGVARPMASDSTVMIGLSDGGANRVFVYVGQKQSSGTSAERAGLMNGISYGIQVVANGVNIASESRDFCFAAAAPAVYSGTFTLAAGGTAAGTTFLRPEDGAWDPANPSDFYFVTTDRMSITSTGVAQASGSRLYRLRFSDVNNIAAGGTIEALIEGTGSYPKDIEMGDNLTVVNTLQGGTRVIITEDPGNNPHSARTVVYDVATDTTSVLLQSDPARFGQRVNGVTTAATPPFNADEEISGVFEATEALGRGWFIQNTQAHYALANPLVEGGQLYAYYAPAVIGSCIEDCAESLDGMVDSADMGALLSAWGQATNSRADINRNGYVDGDDFAQLLAKWGPCN